MAFKKGSSGNPNGRPKGSGNKISGQLRVTITEFLEENFESIRKDFSKLPARDKAKLYCDLLQYGVPKLQSISMTPDFEDLSEEQLDYLLENLKNSIK